jgi:L-aminopeptidase/D-esterase-like protein
MAGDGMTDAICFAGGSLLGLQAVTGVTAELFAQKQYLLDDIPVVRGAILFDFARPNIIYPDHTLGRMAIRSARSNWFPFGRRGAGCSANLGAGLDWSGTEPGGQGGAFRQVGLTKVAVFSVVNAIGAIVDRSGSVVRGHYNQETNRRVSLFEQIQLSTGQPSADAPTRNSTLTIVITNQKLELRQLTQLGRQVHSSMARAIQPFHTGYDGDTLFAVTTAEVENDALPTPALGVVASELAWDAVLSCFEN